MKVTSSGGSKVMAISGASKGNRNALYTGPFAMGGKVLIEFDWKPGTCTGGTSYGEIRLADGNGKVFFSSRTNGTDPLQYSYGGSISNGGLETAPWTNIDSSFSARDKMYHFAVIADFDSKTLNATVSLGTKKAEIKDVPIEIATGFQSIEVLAVRQEKNFDWSTEVDNIKAGIAKN